VSTFHERKAARAALQGLKSESCVACMGTGRYDSTGTPRCSACNGTGKTCIDPDRYIPTVADVVKADRIRNQERPYRKNRK